FLRPHRPFQHDDRIELDTGLPDTADGSDQRNASEYAIKLGVLGAEVVDQPAIETRLAVPFQTVDVLPHRIEPVFQAQLFERLAHGPNAGLELVCLVYSYGHRERRFLEVLRLVIDQHLVVENVVTAADAEHAQRPSGIGAGRTWNSLPVGLVP